MSRINEELRINARQLRARAKKVEAAWREAQHIKRLSAKRDASTKAGHRAERKAAVELARHRDRQSGLTRPASAVRIVKPDGGSGGET